jgi:hypothetical protein
VAKGNPPFQFKNERCPADVLLSLGRAHLFANGAADAGTIWGATSTMTDWLDQKFHRLRELNFPSVPDLAIDLGMKRAVTDPKHGEVAKGTHPWQSVRPSKVERARQLLKDPTYPSKKTLRAVGELLARNLDPGSPKKPKS